MKISMRVAAVAVVAGAIGLGSLALMSPAVAHTLGAPLPAASASPGGGYGPGGGYDHGRGMGAGMGNGTGGGMMSGDRTRGHGMGAGAGNGDCTELEITAAKGTLTEAQRTTLAQLAQEDKLAHDLYAAFADKYDAMVFDHIAASETAHLTALRTLMQRYGVSDPTKDVAAGKFSDPAVQTTYDQLLASGSGSEQAAFAAGKRVEQTDLDDLQRALTGLDAPDAKQVYTHLVDASKRHLAAFDRWATR